MKPKCTFCALALLFAGCGSDDFSGPDRPGVDLAVEAAIEAEQVAIKQQWGMGDQIGVSVVGMDDYAVDTNVAYEFDDATGSFVPTESPIYLKGAAQQLTAYYPYVESKNAHPIGVRVNADVENQPEQFWCNLDYLYATASATREAPVAKFAFTHTMSQLALQFLPDTEVEGALTYTLSGLKVEGEFDTQYGVVAPVEGVAAKDMVLTTTTKEAVLIVVPQRATLTLEVLYNNKVYSGAFEETTFKAGVCSSYTVRLDSTTETSPELIITHEGDGAWRPGQGGEVSSEPEEDADDEQPDDGSGDDSEDDQPVADTPIDIPTDDSAWESGQGGEVSSEEEHENQ